MADEKGVGEFEQLEQLKTRISFIDSLLRGHDTNIMQRNVVDRRILGELDNLLSAVKGFEKRFLDIIQKDAEALFNVASKDPDRCERCVEMMEKMNEILDEYEKIKAYSDKKNGFLKKHVDGTKEYIKEAEQEARKEKEAAERQRRKFLFDSLRQVAA